MKNQLDKAIRRVMAARHAEHRRAAVLVILALLTILSVSWRLHQVGIAMTDDEYSCGYEEHIVWQWPDPIMPAAEDDDTLTAAAATPQYDSEGNLKLDNLLTSTAISMHHQRHSNGGKNV